MKRGFRHIQGGAEIPGSLRGGVVAIGNFDGVHRGHQSVLGRAIAEARQGGRPALVLTFEPHPRSVIKPAVPLWRITPAPMKARLVAALGFDAIVEQTFSSDFAAQSAERFVTAVLCESLGIGHAVTGFDFHFGKDRQGGPDFLKEAGRRHGFAVSMVEAFADENGQVVSSTRIREALAAGAVAQAAGLLGYRYTLAAQVVRGRQLGRSLGYPTANMALAPQAALRHGVYAVRLRRANGSLHAGVASFGRRPTVESDGVPLLETYVFDFDGDLYGETASISFFGFLRGEEKFDSIDQLVARMRCDEVQARALLSGVRPLGELDRQIAFEPG